MPISRRDLLARGASLALASTGLYALIDTVTDGPRRVSTATLASDGALSRGDQEEIGRALRHRRTASGVAGSLPLEQYLVNGLESVTDKGIVVTVPPLHHVVVTARLDVAYIEAALAEAQQLLESALSGMESDGLLDFTPSGLSLAVAWGLSYFDGLPGNLASEWLPVDLRASRMTGTPTLAVLDSIRFPSDPASTILEHNDVAVIFASDSLANITSASNILFGSSMSSLWTVTSIRRGFVDGHYVGTGTQSLTKQMALQAGVAGAAAIPDSAELFLGFTSTQTGALGQSNISNFETLPGVTNQWPNGYFANGTAMHLSHLYEDLPAWYGGPYQQRARAATSPELSLSPGTQTIPEGPANVESLARVTGDYKTYGYVGHSSSMQPASRLPEPLRDNYGVPWVAGSPVPVRADFNTLDNPFAYSSDPSLDGMRPGAAAGLHFVIFTPTTGLFNQVRLAMDGQYGPRGDLGPGAVHGPFNKVLQTTHRQNFLVPPRAHRSFPLAELIGTSKKPTPGGPPAGPGGPGGPGGPPPGPGNPPPGPGGPGGPGWAGRAWRAWRARCSWRARCAGPTRRAGSCSPQAARAWRRVI
jgi:hypothetical protein